MYASDWVAIVCSVLFVGAAWSPFVLMLCGVSLPHGYGVFMIVAMIGAGLIYERFG